MQHLHMHKLVSHQVFVEERKSKQVKPLGVLKEMFK